MAKLSDRLIQPVECRDWDDLIASFDDAHGWIFRGHCSAQWSLQTGVERLAPIARDKPTRIEFGAYRQFRRRAHNHLAAHQVPESDGEWLAVMQHFGAPTRLLDFTYSPYVAAYFAFEDPPADSCPNCAIWAVNPIWLQRQVGGIALSAGAMGLPATAYRHAVEASKVPPPPGIDPFNAPDDFMVGGFTAGMVKDRALSNAPPRFVVQFDPERLSDRMAAQQGLFLWPSTVDVTFMDNLLSLPDVRDGVRQVVIPAMERGRALEQLRLMNITRASLFPGLEGFARSFRQMPIRESAQSRQQRLIIRELLKSVPAPDLEQQDRDTDE